MNIKKIGIIAAMDIEVKLLKEALDDSRTLSVAGSDYHTGRIGNYEVVMMRCGIGKVSAALGAQAMISQFHPDCIINTGCAGAMDSSLKVGDVVLSECAVEWDMDTTAFGDPRGYISSLNTVRMMADKELTELVRKHIPADIRTVSGLVASGDQFICTKQQRDIILGAFPDAKCAEMEGAAIGHVCVSNDVPYTIVRSMSDTADGNSGVDYPAFAKKASEQSAAILIDMLRNS